MKYFCSHTSKRIHPLYFQTITYFPLCSKGEIQTSGTAVIITYTFPDRGRGRGTEPAFLAAPSDPSGRDGAARGGGRGRAAVTPSVSPSDRLDGGHGAVGVDGRL